MLTTFKTDQGMLVLRSESIISIEDTGDPEQTSIVTWLSGTTEQDRLIQGTASENLDRIQQEELDGYTRVQNHQQRMQEKMNHGLPIIPQPRRKGGR